MVIVINGADFSSSNIGQIDISDKTVVSIAIEGLSTVSGTSDAALYKCRATYDDQTTAYVQPTWEITSGSNYASIDANGNLTIKSGASSSAVTVKATLRDKTATKNVTVTYDLGLNAFTLNAISESGNSGMTDAQKTALNNFFGAVGAYGSASTAWSKIERAYMPLIVANVANAGHDFTENDEDLTINSSTFQLRNHGIVSTLNEEGSTNVPTRSMKINKTDFSVFEVLMEDGASAKYSAFRFGYNGDSGSNRAYMVPACTTDSSGYKMYMEWVTPSGAKINALAQTGGLSGLKYKLHGLSLTGTANAKVLQNDGTYTTVTCDNYANIGTDTNNVNAYILGNASGKIATSNAMSVGIIFMGKGLSESEMTVLKNATDALVAAFV